MTGPADPVSPTSAHHAAIRLPLSVFHHLTFGNRRASSLTVKRRDTGDAASSESDILRGARKGNPEALEALVALHQSSAFRVSLGILGDDADAQDATQEGMVRALKGLAGFRGDSSFRTWLLAIVANVARDILRRTSRRREVPLDDDLAGNSPFGDGVVLQSEAARVRALLAHLPEKQRLAVQLRIDDGLSFCEVGDVIGSSEGSARVNYHHGIRRLKEWLKE